MNKTIEVTKSLTLDFDGLYEKSWSGAISTLDTVKENDKEEELMELILEVFSMNQDLDESGIDVTQLNDFLWFDTEFIFESLEIEEED